MQWYFGQIPWYFGQIRFHYLVLLYSCTLVFSYSCIEVKSSHVEDISNIWDISLLISWQSCQTIQTNIVRIYPIHWDPIGSNTCIDRSLSSSYFYYYSICLCCIHLVEFIWAYPIIFRATLIFLTSYTTRSDFMCVILIPTNVLPC